jgi:hypothetical protein
MDYIELILNSTTIISGNEITGKVFLHLLDPISSSKLILLFRGKEKTFFKKQSRSGKYHKEYLGNWTTKKFGADLAEFDNLPPGEHHFPFSFETPLDLAGSFELNTTKARASIEYYLKVVLADTSKSKLLKKKAKIWVIQGLMMMSPLVTEFQTPVMTCSCIQRGFCDITINLNKGCFNTNEELEILVSVNNSQARVDINSVECILWFVCRLKSNEGQVHFFRKCVFANQSNEEIKHKTVNGRYDEFRCIMKFPLKHKDFDMAVCQTTLGKILQCTYSLQVSLEYGTFIQEEPDIQMPIYVNLIPDYDVVDVEDHHIRISRESYKHL